MHAAAAHVLREGRPCGGRLPAVREGAARGDARAP